MAEQDFNKRYLGKFRGHDGPRPFGGPMGPGNAFGKPRRIEPLMGVDKVRGGCWARYDNAYGAYQGGYGPGEGYGPRNFGPNDRFGPGNGYGPGYRHGPGNGYGPDSGFGDGNGYGPDFYPDDGPGFGTGRGFGPAGPPFPSRKKTSESPMKFLLRCGVSPDNLKNLPRNFLRMIEPNSCGLCATTFDTFPLARIHYISKGHFKKQKKWVMDSIKKVPGSGSSREVSLKSRDLYCELCDINITSKAHAEAHYSGKPHRSTVEGRKLAKNPLLLQPEMKGRLVQLVQREKLYLKNVAEQETRVQESRPIVPRRYCDICKTTVTCSEQLTAHLNGKRHLAKEKQHILGMMKGTVNVGDANEDADKEAIEVDYGETEGTGEKEADDDEQDSWVHGTGESWDHTETAGNGE